MPQTAAGCRIDPPVSEPSASGARLAATAAAEPPDEPPGTRASSQGLSVGPYALILCGRAHRELVHVGLAEENRAGLLEAAYDRGIIRGPERPQHPAPAGRWLPLDADQVLDRYRNPRQRTELVTGLAPLVDCAGLTEHVIGIEMNKHVETLQPKGAVEQVLDDLFGADGPLLQIGN